MTQDIVHRDLKLCKLDSSDGMAMRLALSLVEVAVQLKLSFG